VLKEIERVIQILGRRTKNNPVLEEPGSARRSLKGLATVLPKMCQILSKKTCNHPGYGLVAGTKTGEFEERLKTILDETVLPGM